VSKIWNVKENKFNAEEIINEENIYIQNFTKNGKKLIQKFSN
jgi:hypothetical protein